MDKFKTSVIAFAVLAVLVGFSMLAGALMVPSSPTVAAETNNDKRPRQFYQTRTTHDGSQALSACAIGYHMASLWEILDPSNLRYDTQLGNREADSGFGPPASFGPPSEVRSWVRTGAQASGAEFPGIGNCEAWTSSSEGDFGTAISLTNDWRASFSGAIAISPWQAGQDRCDLPRRVWCVQD